MKKALGFCLVLLFLINHYAHGIIYINDGIEHTIGHEMDGWLWVDHESPGTGTSLNIVPGGKISRLTAYEDSIIRINGGSISYSSSNMPDSGSLLAHDSSQIIMEYGSVNKYFDLADNSRAIIYGGSIGNRLHVGNGAQATVYNAGIARLGATQSGNVEFWDGSISSEIYAGHNATITIHGSDFMLDGNPVEYSTLTSLYGGLYYDEPVRYLSANTMSGGTITAKLYIGGGAEVILSSIPEPATLLLLGMGGLLIRKRK